MSKIKEVILGAGTLGYYVQVKIDDCYKTIRECIKDKDEAKILAQSLSITHKVLIDDKTMSGRKSNMGKYECGKCGMVEGFLDKRGTQTAICCNNCGKFIKWAGKSELALFKRDQAQDEIQTNEDQQLLDAAKRVVSLIRCKYGEDTEVIIKADSVRIIQTKKDIPLR